MARANGMKRPQGTLRGQVRGMKQSASGPEVPKGGTPHQQIWWPLHHTGLGYGVSMPLDSHPEVARLLGLVIERWNAIEATLASSLAVLLDGNDHAARAIIYSMNATSVRIAMVRAVAREVVPDGPEKRGFLYLLDKINDLQKERNELIHGEYWHADLNDLELVTIRPMNAEPISYRSVTDIDLQKHIAACEEREFQLSLAIDRNPKRNVPNLQQMRSRALSLCKTRHAQAMESNRERQLPRPRSSRG
jgi:hypothetical protein